MRSLLTLLEAKADAPNYRKASEGQASRCGNCKFFKGGQCTKWSFKASASFVCDSWASREKGKYYPSRFFAGLKGSKSKTPPPPSNGNGNGNGGEPPPMPMGGGD